MVLATTDMLRKLPVGQVRGLWESWPKKLIWRYSIGVDLALSPVDVLSARCVQSLLLSFSRSFVLFSTFLCDRFSLSDSISLRNFLPPHLEAAAAVSFRIDQTNP